MRGFLKGSRVLQFICSLQLLVICGLAFMGFQNKGLHKTLEVQHLIVRSPQSKMAIHLNAEGKDPEISIVGDSGNKVVEIHPDQFGGGQIRLSGAGAGASVFVQGGQSGGIYLKNQIDKMVGSWTVLKDGGSGLGLANSHGKAASIIRGGVNPSITFFGSQADPMAALGVIQKVPHMLVSGKQGNEAVLIHGGSPNSVVVVDERGQVKVLISKQGIFQGKKQKEGKGRSPKQEEKVFSFDDSQDLFSEPLSIR